MKVYSKNEVTISQKIILQKEKKHFADFAIFICAHFISLFTWSKQKWLFWRAVFYSANQNNL